MDMTPEAAGGGGSAQPLAFRAASRGDAAAIVDLVNRCYRGDASRRGWTSEADLLEGDRTDRAEIEELIFADDAILLLCLRAERLVGSVHLQRRPGSCYLGMLVVDPEEQRAGIGRRILEEAERHARQAWGAARMTLTVISARRELVAYYERRGYRRTGETLPFEEDGRHGAPRVGGIEFAVLEKVLGGGKDRPAPPEAIEDGRVEP